MRRRGVKVAHGVDLREPKRLLGLRITSQSAIDDVTCGLGVRHAAPSIDLHGNFRPLILPCQLCKPQAGNQNPDV